jgi:hypothetical protein
MENKTPPAKKNYETLAFWKGQIDTAKKDVSDFVTSGRKIQDRYRDEGRSSRGSLDSNFNILYSNTETILPMLFSESPEADCRAQDSNSMPARKAAKMLEDTINHFIKNPESYSSIESAVKDMLLPGYGCIRVAYKPYFSEREVEEVKYDDDGVESVEVKKEDVLAIECIEFKYQYWEDVLMPKVRRYEDLPWQAFRGRYTRQEAEEEFGKKIAAKLEYNYREDNAPEDKGDSGVYDGFSQAEVWEVWYKEERKVIWFSDCATLQEPLRIDDDPLELDGFFPTAKPLSACFTNNTILPVPLFVQYQDLAEELNEVSTRIRRNVDNLKRRGVYDASFPQLANMVEGQDNTFVAIENLQRMLEKGGLKTIMQSEEIGEQVNVIVSLYQQRKEIIQAIYEVMGYADILRGVSDPRETASAQRIKGRFGTLRISRMQREVQRFIRDLVRIAGEIIVNRFEPKSIALVTGVDIGEVARMQEILQQTEPSSVLIDIQTDSTIAADDMADKDEMVEFMRAISEFIAQAPAMTQSIGLKATSELLMIMLKRFKMGRDIEQTIMDRVVELIQQEQAAKNQPPQPSPEEMEVQRKMAKDQADAQLKFAELQLKDRELTLEESKVGLENQREETKIDFQGMELAIKALATEAEAENPDKNILVGV